MDRPYDSKFGWMLDSSKIVRDNLLGAGTFANVYLGRRIDTDDLVALKQLKNEALVCKAKQEAEFDREVRMMMEISQHDCILRFFGMTEHPRYMVLEYCERGSMYDVIQNRDPEFTWERRLNAARQIAKGMCHMHSKLALHRDLKSPNVMLKDNWQAKVSDFGFARFCRSDTATSLTKATNPIWTDPELLRDAKKPCDQKTDVYSFGIILYELLLMELPCKELVGLTDDSNGLMRLYYQLVIMKKDIRHFMQISESQLPGGRMTPQLKRYVQLLGNCTDPDASRRPSFQQIVVEIRKIMESSPDTARLVGGSISSHALSSMNVTSSTSLGVSTPTSDMFVGGSSAFITNEAPLSSVKITTSRLENGQSVVLIDRDQPGPVMVELPADEAKVLQRWNSESHPFSPFGFTLCSSPTSAPLPDDNPITQLLNQPWVEDDPPAPQLPQTHQFHVSHNHHYHNHQSHNSFAQPMFAPSSTSIVHLPQVNPRSSISIPSSHYPSVELATPFRLMANPGQFAHMATSFDGINPRLVSSAAPSSHTSSSVVSLPHCVSGTSALDTRVPSPRFPSGASSGRQQQLHLDVGGNGTHYDHGKNGYRGQTERGMTSHNMQNGYSAQTERGMTSHRIMASEHSHGGQYNGQYNEQYNGQYNEQYNGQYNERQASDPPGKATTLDEVCSPPCSRPNTPPNLGSPSDSPRRPADDVSPSRSPLTGPSRCNSQASQGNGRNSSQSDTNTSVPHSELMKKIKKNLVEFYCRKSWAASSGHHSVALILQSLKGFVRPKDRLGIDDWPPLPEDQLLLLEETYDLQVKIREPTPQELAVNMCLEWNRKLPAEFSHICKLVDVDKNNVLNKKEYCLLAYLLQKYFQDNFKQLPNSISEQQVDRLLGYPQQEQSATDNGPFRDNSIDLPDEPIMPAKAEHRDESKTRRREKPENPELVTYRPGAPWPFKLAKDEIYKLSGSVSSAGLDLGSTSMSSSGLDLGEEVHYPQSLHTRSTPAGGAVLAAPHHGPHKSFDSAMLSGASWEQERQASKLLDPGFDRLQSGASYALRSTSTTSNQSSVKEPAPWMDSGPTIKPSSRLVWNGSQSLPSAASVASQHKQLPPLYSNDYKAPISPFTSPPQGLTAINSAAPLKSEPSLEPSSSSSSYPVINYEYGELDPGNMIPKSHSWTEPTGQDSRALADEGWCGGKISDLIQRVQLTGLEEQPLALFTVRSFLLSQDVLLEDSLIQVMVCDSNGLHSEVPTHCALLTLLRTDRLDGLWAADCPEQTIPIMKQPPDNGAVVFVLRDLGGDQEIRAWALLPCTTTRRYSESLASCLEYSRSSGLSVQCNLRLYSGPMDLTVMDHARYEKENTPAILTYKAGSQWPDFRPGYLPLTVSAVPSQPALGLGRV